MSTVGSEIIPFTGVSRRETCICGSLECLLLSSFFQSVGDARGCKFTSPTMGGSRNAEIKKYKLQRICHHLGLGADNYEQYASTDGRDRSVLGSEAKRLKTNHSAEDEMPESKGKEAKRKRSFIAMHHFHPEVVRLFVVDNKIQFKDSLTDSFVRGAGLWQNGYTEDDYFPGETRQSKYKAEKWFVPVPTYKGAMEDYSSVAKKYQITELVKECKHATTFSDQSFLTPGWEDGEMQPAKKLPKLSADRPEHLQRAVCVMADEIEKLKLEKTRLEIQLKDERKRSYSETLIKIASGNVPGFSGL